MWHFSFYLLFSESHLLTSVTTFLNIIEYHLHQKAYLIFRYAHSALKVLSCKTVKKKSPLRRLHQCYKLVFVWNWADQGCSYQAALPDAHYSWQQASCWASLPTFPSFHPLPGPGRSHSYIHCPGMNCSNMVVKQVLQCMQSLHLLLEAI